MANACKAADFTGFPPDNAQRVDHGIPDSVQDLRREQEADPWVTPSAEESSDGGQRVWFETAKDSPPHRGEAAPVVRDLFACAIREDVAA